MEGSVWVKLEKRRFAPAERVEFTAGAQTRHRRAGQGRRLQGRDRPARRHAAPPSPWSTRGSR